MNHYYRDDTTTAGLVTDEALEILRENAEVAA